jgi:hypothetical protein
MTTLYNIFTLFLRHLYDLPRPVRHTLQRQGGCTLFRLLAMVSPN